MAISDAAVLPRDPELENTHVSQEEDGRCLRPCPASGEIFDAAHRHAPGSGSAAASGAGGHAGAEGLAAKASWLQPVADIFSAAGGAVFDNLPLIFAVGVAVGFAKKADGSTGVAALFGFLVYRAVSWTMSPIILGEPPP